LLVGRPQQGEDLLGQRREAHDERRDRTRPVADVQQLDALEKPWNTQRIVGRFVGFLTWPGIV
jgi:hypothetical protein